MTLDTPGPELDAYLALNLMGWKAKVFAAPSTRDIPRCHVIDEDEAWWLFEPSTSPALAFGEIVPAMYRRAEKRGEAIAVSIYFDFDGIATVDFGGVNLNGCMVHKTVTGAVCLAAKAAMEAEPERSEA